MVSITSSKSESRNQQQQQPAASPNRLEERTASGRRTLRLLSFASESELIERAQKGDKAAFEQLVARHEDFVKAICHGSVRWSIQFDDARQEVLLALWKGLPKFEGRNGAQFKTWLYRVCVNAVNGLYRRTVPDPVEIVQERIEVTGRGPEDIIVARETTRWALDQLKEEYRVAVFLAEMGLKHREIGLIQNTKTATAKTRVFKGRRALLRLLGDDGV